MARSLAAVSLGLAAAASCLLLIWPLYSGYSTLTGPAKATLLEVNGPRALVSLALPVLIAMLPVVCLRRSARIGAAVALGGFAVLGGFSIGMFYLPSALLMGLAACR